MRRLFRVILLSLGLLIVALASALAAMQFAIHGREVTIPKVTGLTPFEAERVASSTGLQLAIERQFYSTDVPEGRLMTQMPSPGTKVRRGWTLRAAQSLGPQRVSIPDVTTESERAAELNLRRRGLSLGSVAQVNLPETPQDQVASQSPPANASGVSAPKIDLLVSLGPETASYVMPNLTGQSLGAATSALQDAGLHVGKVTMAPEPNQPTDPQTALSPPPPAVHATAEPNAASIIVRQVPAPGQKITTGASVNFEVR